MSPFKQFFRITLLSAILALLLIYIGINYHWGGYFKKTPEQSTSLTIPEKAISDKETPDQNQTLSNEFTPEIIEAKNSNSLLDSMTKDQIAEQCSNLLSPQIVDPVTLEIATVNCVMSNFQETYQNSNQLDQSSSVNKNADAQKLSIIKTNCINAYKQFTNYSVVEKELLVGMCVSDNLTISK